MTTLFITFIIIISIFLILIASLQSSKKEGVGNSIGSMGAHQIIGVKKTSDLLEDITKALIIGLFAVSLGTSVFLKNRNNKSVQSPNLERIQHELPIEPIEEPKANDDQVNTDTTNK